MPIHSLLFLATLLTAPCPTGTTLEGLDVSEFNGAVDWAAVADAGIQFAFAKATEGLTLRDSRFEANWAGMRANGLIRGAYHFFHASDDGTSQADAYLACVGNFEPGDLPPVLDWETSDDRTPEEATDAAEAFIAEIALQTGQTTIVYTYRGYWDSIGAPPAIAGSPLWLASDADACPTAPAPWSTWLFWQYADDGSVPGVSGPVDRDRFSGDLNALRALGGAPLATVAPAPLLQDRSGCGGECVWPACAIALAARRRRGARDTVLTACAGPSAPSRRATRESRR